MAPGRYVGEFPSEMAGSYLIVVNPGAGKAPIRTGVNVGYSAEYRDHETNRALLESLARIPAGDGDGPAGEFVEAGPRRASPRPEQIAQNPFRRDLPPAVTNQIDLAVARRRRQLRCSGPTCSSAACRSTSTGCAPRSAASATSSCGRERAVAAPETMSRLRSRKQEIGEQIESRRAAARFELDDADAAAAAARRLERAADAKPPRQPASAPAQAPNAPPPESYTERLLSAKKQVRRDRDDGSPR